MRYKIAIVLAISTFSCAGISIVSDKTFELQVTCRAGACEYTGKDLFFSVTLTNVSTNSISIPFQFLKKSGPAIKINGIDDTQEYWLKKPLVDYSLRQKYDDISPGKSLSFDWVIKPDEFMQLSPHEKKFIATIHVLSSIVVNDRIEQLDLSKTLEIDNCHSQEGI